MWDLQSQTESANLLKRSIEISFNSVAGSLVLGDFFFLGTKHWLSPSIHNFDDVFIHSGLSAAFDHELPSGLSLRVEDRPNGVSISLSFKHKNMSPYLRIEALSHCSYHWHTSGLFLLIIGRAYRLSAIDG